VLLVPDNCIASFFVIPGHGASGEIDIAIAVKVAVRGAVGTGQRGNRMVGKREYPFVFQPLQRMTGSEFETVHGVAVGIEQIEIVVLIEIHQRDTGRSVGWVGSLVNSLFTKLPMIFIEKRDNDFVFL